MVEALIVGVELVLLVLVARMFVPVKRGRHKRVNVAVEVASDKLTNKN